jgi:hypothetical protein
MATHAGNDRLGKDLPPLPLAEWRQSKETLHRFVQIVGKIRLAAAPFRNHWWHVTLYVTPRGLTTDLIPYGDGAFAIEFDFVEHRLTIVTSDGGRESIPLTDGLSVARFDEEVFARLAALGLDIAILGKPYELTPAIPFARDTTHASYDADAVHRWWRIMVWTDGVFQEFDSRFVGKTSPIHLFWHSLDLAVTRFSGRRAPVLPEADPVTREAYSHEVISFGFWAGDDRMTAPAFYSYTAPEPPALRDTPLRPEPAHWVDTGRGSLAILDYETLRHLDAPRLALLDFLESAYQAGAMTAGWDLAAYAAVPPE